MHTYENWSKHQQNTLIKKSFFSHWKEAQTSESAWEPRPMHVSWRAYPTSADRGSTPKPAPDARARRTYCQGPQPSAKNTRITKRHSQMYLSPFPLLSCSFFNLANTMFFQLSFPSGFMFFLCVFVLPHYLLHPTVLIFYYSILSINRPVHILLLSFNLLFLLYFPHSSLYISLLLFPSLLYISLWPSF